MEIKFLSSFLNNLRFDGNFIWRPIPGPYQGSKNRRTHEIYPPASYDF